MSRDEIIAMANEVELCQSIWIDEQDEVIDSLIAFAKLVAAKERVACFDAAYDAYATTAVLEAIEARGKA